MSSAWRKYLTSFSHTIHFIYIPSSCVSYSLASRYLSYRLQPKVVGTPAAEHDAGFERDYTSRVSGAVSGAIFSIGDLFRDIRDGTKAVRFPKDLLKVLEQKLQDIAMSTLR